MVMFKSGDLPIGLYDNATSKKAVRSAYYVCGFWYALLLWQGVIFLGENYGKR